MIRTRELWQAWRAAPWRGELLAEAIAAARAEAPTGEGWEDVALRLGSMQAVDHIMRVARARVRPELLLLFERLRRLTPEEVLGKIDLETIGGGAALERLWWRLRPEGLRRALAGVTWGRHATCRERVLAAMLRTGLAEQVGEEALRRVRALAEPGRSSIAAAIVGQLAEDDPLRVSLRARIEASDGFTRVGLLRAMPAPIGRAWLGLPPVWEAMAWSEADRRERATWEPAELRGLVEAEAAAEWERVAAIAEPAARLDAWELRMAQLGPVATLDESRRWLAAVRAVIAARPDEVYRLQVGVPARLWDEALAGLAPALACEALVWLVWNDPQGDAERALTAVLTCEALAEKERVRLLGMLLEWCLALPGDTSGSRYVPGAERMDVRELELRAAEALINNEEATPREAMLAALHLTRARLAFWADRWCQEDPLLQGEPAHGRRCLTSALARLAGAAGPAGRAEVVAIVRGLASAWTEAEQVAALAECADWMDEGERRELVRRACAVGEPRAVGSLIRWVPAQEVAAALAGPIARALALPEVHARWGALGELVGGLAEETGAEILRGLWAHEQAREGTDGAVHAFPRWAMDDALRRDLLAHEVRRPYRPYTAWLLGTYARGLPAAEVEAALDQAIAEFAAIAGEPTSPGNDAGPFVEMADLLSEAQVRRALEVVDRMAALAGRRWGGDLDCSRQALGLRLAELGYGEEAEAVIRATRDPAWALGGLAGQRLSRGAGWEAVAGLFETTGEEALASAISGVVGRLPAQAVAGLGAVAEGLLRRIHREEDPERRGELVHSLWQGFGPALAGERWAAEFRAHTTGTRRVELLLALAATAAGAGYVEEALAEAEGLEPEDWFEAYCAVAPRLPAPRRVHLIVRWMERRGPYTTVLRGLEDGATGREIAGVLAALGGDAALVVMARRLIAVADMLD
ncbi:MAG: hypothetical protein JNL82_22205 [Myxococcales bacterium]|nr:hypothetical protein [Myxococcales bacterium]